MQHPARPTGILMAAAHASQPHYGVQFHPESVSTQFGDQLIRNFLQLARDHILAAHPHPKSPNPNPNPNPNPRPSTTASARSASLNAALTAALTAAAAAASTTAPSAFALPRPAAAAAAAAAVEHDRDGARQAEGVAEGVKLKWLRLSHTATDAGGSDALFWCVALPSPPTPPHLTLGWVRATVRARVRVWVWGWGQG